MQTQQPIGIFDSGVGGLTVARVLFDNLPREQVIYLGDTANVPYGSKSVSELVRISEQILSFLVDQKVKLVVAACNTSSSISLPALGGYFNGVPVVGVIEPGARAAVQQTKSGRIGVIATEATVRSRSHQIAVQSIDPSVQVFSQACPLFVPLVESGEVSGSETKKVAAEYLRPIQDAGIDTLVLGCTHYPYLSDVLQQILGSEVTLVDPAGETIKEVIALLSRVGGFNNGPEREWSDHRYLATGPVESFYQVAPRLLEGYVPMVQTVSIE